MHPTNRSERRHQRERVIARRRFIWGVVWKGFTHDEFTNPLTFGRYVNDWSPYHWTPEWGRYAKWNLGCGCKGCHMEKYFDQKRKRRNARKASGSTTECRLVDRKIPSRLWKNNLADYLEDDADLKYYYIVG